ncbi:hypothetical protein, partial [Pseudomonas syringae]|uniref:hypothetical protein n=1 Tax=Pseudomonas syringae TaxID=317 RepID=UPI002E7C384D
PQLSCPMLCASARRACELAHEDAGAGATIVRRSASHAFLDAPRPLDDAERRELRSHAGA